MKRPVRVVSVEPKRGGLHLDLVDRDGEIILGSFGYFHEEKLRTIAACINGVKKLDQRDALRALEWSDFAKREAR